MIKVEDNKPSTYLIEFIDVKEPKTLEIMDIESNCDRINVQKAKDENLINDSPRGSIESNILSQEIEQLDRQTTLERMTVESQLINSSQQNKMRIALGVLFRLVLPLCNGVARGWQGIRGVKLLKLLRNLGASRHMLTNMLAYAANTISLSLSSVQVAHRIDPILKIMKLKKKSTTKSITSTSHTSLDYQQSQQQQQQQQQQHQQIAETRISRNIVTESEEPEKCVTLNILAEPSIGMPIRADIIFIHGLHGSLVNTWKQGLWNSEGKQVKFERPPRPPIRPPKRPRHLRSTRLVSPHSKKRARYLKDTDNFSHQEDYDLHDLDDQKNPSCECGQLHPVSHCDDIEYSFPTFRLRLDDNKTDTSICQKQEVNGKPNSENQSNEEKYSPCWPGDWLPLDCPGVRVIALNYTTDPYLWRPVWVRKRRRSSLTERTREMTEMLIEKRVGYGHPIIWVGHSKGGIFIKQIIVDAWESGRRIAAPLWRSSRGVFFYSVPHRGSPLADFNLPLLRQSIELTEIQKNCPSILDLHRRFVALYHSGHLKIDVFSFVETALTLMSVLYLRIVGIDSADPGIGDVCGVHLDHREICKPRNRNCILYTELVKMINKVS